jgi:VCBS repeat-containing protein
MLVSISGTNLSAVAGVSFGSTPASSFSFNASTNQIMAAAPAESAGQVDVHLVSAAGTSLTSSADLFTYSANATSPPVANADAYVLHAGTTLTAGSYNSSAAGLLANDFYPGGSSATAALVSGPTHGTLTLNANGSFNYTPNAQFVGADSFTYQVSVGQTTSNIATVSLDVTDTAPVATSTDYRIHAGTTLSAGTYNSTIAGVLAAATDADNDPLAATLVSSTSNGTLAFNSNGSFTYTPLKGFTGTDSFT